MRLRRTTLAPWLAAFAALLVVGLGGFFLPAIYRERAFRLEHDRTEALLESIRRPAPIGVDSGKWENAWVVVYNGFGNVCFTERQVSVPEMRRLNGDLQRQLKPPPSLQTLEQIWNRLGETGPHGAEYTQRLRPLLDEALEY